jgi:hypothetical protein
LVVQRSHYELARSGHARFQILREHWQPFPEISFDRW